MNLRSLAALLFACAAASAHAGFTNAVLLNNAYDATQPLTNGTVYVVENWASFMGEYDGKSGLAVAPGATVVIYVKKEDGTLWADSYKGEQGGAGGAPTYYETIGGTTLYAAWSDTPDFKAADEQKLVPPARRYHWDDEKLV